MNHKGSVWVSALLYLALGLVLIGIVIGVATPVVNRINDRNVFAQTKSVMLSLDHAIDEVVNEGPGSRRYLSSVEIRKGKVDVDTFADTITWSFDTGSALIEPDVVFEEGPLTILLKEKAVKGEYELTITMAYNSTANLDFTGDSLGSPFTGEFSMTLENAGFQTSDLPTVLLSAQ